ncbi:hypothetical protein RclHR1_24510001 [Rhizophagus clarus]|uniref:Protein BFR2 n=1 Tax=Rhizophagus clarus TaxID=94130 RepID=A0A2Z6QXN7_9GLOM|nr:hypothetical protein RclHR1_24510001 [Rhizophagus clarus]GES85467.1 TRAUB-domain-containing protein [Rhizophagus clarus]
MVLGKKKSLTAQLAELSNPTPIDIDPEEFGETYHTYGFDKSDEENEEVEKDIGREHYVAVGKSSLRRNLFILDDPKYVGKRSSRKDIFENYSNDEDVEMKSWQNSEDEDEGEKMDNKIGDKKDYEHNNEIELNENENIEKNDKISSDDDEGSEDQESDFENKDGDVSLENGLSIQEELRKIEEEERNLLHKMKQNAQEDITKGQHVKTQLGLWDTFLDTRIRLQKAVSVANSFPQNDVYSEFLTPESELAIQETRTELRELLDSLIELRKDLCHENNNIEEISENVINNRKHHLDDNYNEYLWKDIKELYDHFLPYRTQTIDKWSNKVQIASGISLNKRFKAINQGVNTQIEQILRDKERLIKRTQLKRNSDKILGKKEHDMQDFDKDIKNNDKHLSNYDVEIFDDTDFYQQLLRELIESRMIDTDDPIALGMQWAAIRQTKQKKKQVDTKASKGRRLRYHVHEKLQNFMVPVPVGAWHEDMIDELYSSLLGKKYDNDSDSSENENDNENENISKTKEQKECTIEPDLNGLKIFG